MSGGIVELFQAFRRTLCVCPCCGEIVRLSDLHLKYKGKAPRTWLDAHDAKVRQLEKREELFKEKERKIRKDAHERGRAKVPKMISKCIDKDIARFNFDPYDIKALMHPVDFVVFNGMNEGKKIEDITFLSRKTVNEVLNKIRGSLETAIAKEKYDWRIARVSIEGKVELE